MCQSHLAFFNLLGCSTISSTEDEEVLVEVDGLAKALLQLKSVLQETW